MTEETQENETPTNEEEVVEPESTEEEAPVEDKLSQEIKERDEKELQSALAQKDHFREKFEKSEAEIKALESQLNKDIGDSDKGRPPLAVEEYIDISTSLDGLDQREKAYLAEQHRLTGKPLSEIRESEDYSFWQSAYRAKQEKEQALKPNAAQELEDAPKPFGAQLKAASLEEKEKMLVEAGLYKERKQSKDRVDIGKKISTG